MGQKVSPIGFRVGINQDWRSRWFARKGFSKLVGEDIAIRRHIMEKLAHGAISRIEIERAANQVKVDIYTARPGVVIGRKGTEVDTLKSNLEKITGQVQINILEVRKPELDAALIAQNVAGQLVARVSFRRAMKRAVSGAIKSGAKGVKISCAGRLGGAEMSRTEWYREGRVPLQTLRADIDYGFAVARTKFGSIGVKTWVYKGDLIPGVQTEEKKEEELTVRRTLGATTTEKKAKEEAKKSTEEEEGKLEVGAKKEPKKKRAVKKVEKKAAEPKKLAEKTKKKKEEKTKEEESKSKKEEPKAKKEKKKAKTKTKAKTTMKTAKAESKTAKKKKERKKEEK